MSYVVPMTIKVIVAAVAAAAKPMDQGIVDGRTTAKCHYDPENQRDRLISRSLRIWIEQ